MLKQENSAHSKLLLYLRHELCRPINSMVVYSSLLLKDLDTQQDSPWFQDIQTICDCSQQLLMTAIAVLDPARLESFATDVGFNRLKSTLRIRLIEPLSTITGYCRILLEAAPADLVPGIENLDSSAQQLLSQVNDIDRLARQQIQIINSQAEKVNGQLRVQSSLESLSKALESNNHEDRAVVLAASEDKRFQKLQKQIAGSYLDVERLYRPSLYPSLASLSKEDSLSVPTQAATAVISPAQIYLPEGERSLFSSLASRAFLAVDSDLLSSDSPSLSQPCKIVSVQSFRGGTGKSSIVSNLAVSLARQGKRVGIIDIDLQSPSIHMLMDIDSASIGRTLNDYLWNDCPLYTCAHNLSNFLTESVVATGGAIYLIPASIQLDDITRALQADYDKRKLFDSFQIIADDLKLDILLVDTHSGVSEETLQAITACSLLILVLCPDYQDYRGTSIIVDLAKSLSVQEMMLVVNKAPQGFDVTTYRDQLEAAYKVPVANVLPFSEDMMPLTGREIFSADCIGHPIAKAIGEISQRIINGQTEPSE